MDEVALTVTGMTCGHCTARVTNVLKAVPGVKDAVVTLPSSATVKGTADAATLIAAVEGAGFGAAAAAPAESRSVMLRVTGMMCGHCTSTVEHALKAVDGVDAVLVDLEGGGRAKVQGRASVEALIAAVQAVGHGATEAAADPGEVRTCGACASPRTASTCPGGGARLHCQCCTARLTQPDVGVCAARSCLSLRRA